MNRSVACVGELLWDILPSQSVLGGAPANVAYHLRKLGVGSRLVTRVGADRRGEAAMCTLRDRGMTTTDVQVDHVLPTGAAYVQLENAQAKYDFETPAAWDAIEMPAMQVEALVFGTLAQRDARSAATIRQLARGAAMSFYDVNLRAPYTTFDIVSESLSLASAVKVNEAEIAALASEFRLPTQPPQFAAAIASQFPAHTVCVSLGAAGAGLWNGGRWIQLHAPRIAVVDTVGAGDAFFAGLVEGILQMRSPDEALSRAITLGSFVATRAGATPEYEAHDLGL